MAPLSVHIFDNPKRNDVIDIQNTLNLIPVEFNENIKINLIGDKGYVTSKAYYIKNKKINVVYPQRINQSRTSLKNKRLLKKRNVIERAFAQIKKDIIFAYFQQD